MTTSLFAKIITIPLVLIIGMNITNEINYGAYWQPFVVTAVLIIIGIAMEDKFLGDNLWITVILDFLVTFFLIWGVSNIFPSAMVTFFGAFSISVILTIIEYFLHRYIMAVDKSKRSPT
ncbi:DUF2512 family protein [Alteribacillus sp. HJP-4]|uniref:DUF2512 family protein n=1 Tax=Alteribacillus sp. HJP-4 TaxID=2775394 RepID=UPI0035CCD26A